MRDDDAPAGGGGLLCDARDRRDADVSDVALKRGAHGDGADLADEGGGRGGALLGGAGWGSGGGRRRDDRPRETSGPDRFSARLARAAPPRPA